jgi:hypothetical protein
VYPFVEVVARFTVAAFDVVSHMGAQEIACFVQETLIVVGQRDA